MAIVAGAANASGARFYAAHIPHAELTILPGDVGHYVLMSRGTAEGCVPFPALCIDAPVIDRDAIHVQTSELAKAFFARNLAQGPAADGSTEPAMKPNGSSDWQAVTFSIDSLVEKLGAA